MANTYLPISQYREEIVATVKENPVVIITAATGAGKSTQVPQFLLASGHTILVTEPRRLAARTVAQRVAEEYNVQLGTNVGYRTSLERQDGPATQCLFCTDGLALVRELMGYGNRDILVIDEAHEWNMNIEILVAWSRWQIAKGAKFKVIIMSATMDTARLSEYFEGAPIIVVPGKQFVTEEENAYTSLNEDVRRLLIQGRNVLVFQPGKAEIRETVDYVGALADVSAVVLPLHGDLSPQEQALCFARYTQPKCIVATNVAQTSITIDDIDAVVDSGLERRTEWVNGVEGLYLRPISLADREQRKGRAGRTRPGVYIDHCSAQTRPAYPVPEIMRSRLDQTVLRLLRVGIDIEELECFHQPPKKEIQEAKRMLRALGCLGERDEVTAIGERVAFLSVSVPYARMIIEAESLGVVDDIITIAAILEEGGMITRGTGRGWRSAWSNAIRADSESDLLAQLSIFKKAHNYDVDQLKMRHIRIQSYRRVQEIRRRLCASLKNSLGTLSSTGNKTNIIRAICAGMVDHLYFRESQRFFVDSDGQRRELAHESLLMRESPEWIVGLPKDIEPRNGPRSSVRRIIQLATKVDPMVLMDVAPQLIRRTQNDHPVYDPQHDATILQSLVHFNDQLISTEVKLERDHPDGTATLATWLAQVTMGGEKTLCTVSRPSLQAVLAANQDCHRLAIRFIAGSPTRPVIVPYTHRQWKAWYEYCLKGASRLAEVASYKLLRYEYDHQELEQPSDKHTVEYTRTAISTLLQSSNDQEKGANAFAVHALEQLQKRTQSNPTYSPSEALCWLAVVGKTVTRRHSNGRGEPSEWHITLLAGEDTQSWRLSLASSAKACRKNTDEALISLLPAAIHAACAIPKQNPWWILLNAELWILSVEGLALKKKIEELKKESVFKLNIRNVRERLANIMQATATYGYAD
ncbi:MAG: helicase-related protein [Patescibacteria group bacterium]